MGDEQQDKSNRNAGGACYSTMREPMIKYLERDGSQVWATELEPEWSFHLDDLQRFLTWTGMVCCRDFF